MELDDFRQEMESYRRNSDEEARSLKSSHLVHEKLRALYKGLGPSGRRMADEILAEWTLSPEESVRFDARALINDQGIKSAAPALRELACRLSNAPGPAAKYELIAVKRLLEKLASSHPNH